MRTVFHAELDQLAVDLGEMCARAADVMRWSTVALVDADHRFADELSAELSLLDRLDTSVSDRAFSLLALQSPVARDLRVVVSAIQIAADAHRMGELAADVAKVAHRHQSHEVIPPAALNHVAAMGRVAVDLAERVTNVVVTGDASLAQRIRGDDAMDELHRQLFDLVTDRRWPHGAAAAADTILLGRFYGRFADHAMEIARRVVFRDSGHIPRASGFAPSDLMPS